MCADIEVKPWDRAVLDGVIRQAVARVVPWNARKTHPEIVEDLVQEGWISALRAERTFDPGKVGEGAGAKGEPWLRWTLPKIYRDLKRAWRKIVAETTRFRQAGDPAEPVDLDSVPDRVHAEEGADEVAELVELALGGASVSRGATVGAVVRAGGDLKAAARKLGCSYENVRQHVRGFASSPAGRRLREVCCRG